jgi:hypothetical protein
MKLSLSLLLLLLLPLVTVAMLRGTDESLNDEAIVVVSLRNFRVGLSIRLFLSPTM